MMIKNSERGVSKILILVILVGVIGVYVGIQILPLTWDHARFEQEVQTAMVTALTPPYKDVTGAVTQKIISLLDTMGAQYQKEHIKVEVGEEYKTIQVQVWYARPHHLPFYPNPKQFYASLKHTSILPKAIAIPTRTPVEGIE